MEIHIMSQDNHLPYVWWGLKIKEIRRYSVKLDAITIPSFISKRYGEKKPVIMCIASLMILIFFVPYVAVCAGSILSKRVSQPHAKPK